MVSCLTVSPGEGTDSGLASVLSSLEFCLKPCGSEASILEDLSKAINLVHTRRNLAENDRVLLNRAHRAQQEYERYDLFSCTSRYFLEHDIILIAVIVRVNIVGMPE
jgi:hypothetical protein